MGEWEARDVDAVWDDYTVGHRRAGRVADV